MVHLWSRLALSHPDPAALGLRNDQGEVNPFLALLINVFRWFLVVRISGLVGGNTV